MKNDREFDEYLNHLDARDQQALNAYMDNLDLENNSELDDYLNRIEEGVQGGAGTYQEGVQGETGLYQETVQGTTGAYQDFGQGGNGGYYESAQGVSGAYQEPAQGGTGVYQESVQGGAGIYQESSQGLSAYIELEPQIESFQDYTTARMKAVNPQDYANSEGYANMADTVNVGNTVDVLNNANANNSYNTVNADNSLNVSLLDDEYEQPFVDTIRYKDDEYNASAASSNSRYEQPYEEQAVRRNERRPGRNSTDDYDSVFYIDSVPKQSKAPVVLAILGILLMLGGGVYATYHFTDGFKDFAFFKKDSKTETTTELVQTTEATTEEATTEEPVGPYATVDYTLHKPHATDSTIVYDSNSFSLRYPKEEWPIFRDDNDEPRDATQDELYPAITLEARDGSLNSTNPVPDNLAETQTLTSRYMVLVDLSDDSIIAKRDSDVVVNPASMTKILTVLTAADMIEDLDDTFIMTDEAIKYAYDNGGSAVGFLAGEKVTVRDLIYGTIVCSGADAAVGLAQYCCGSHEAFVEKMNDKAKELGIDETAHFTNVVGMYDENLHCTMEDMATILATAMQNDLLKDVLNARTYQTTPDPTILPEDVRKELGITVFDDEAEEGNSEETAGYGETTEASDDTANSETAETSETTDDTTTDTADATTEEIDPGVKLIATEGIQISNWFMRRIEDKDTGGEVLGAKTGYVSAAGFCCASYYRSASGKEYVCVTGDTYSSWRCIYDHVGIYRSLAN